MVPKKRTVLHKLSKSQQGKKNRASGSAWERKVRENLESNGWIVDRWGNNVQWDDNNINKPPQQRTGKLIQAKAKYNPFTRGLMMSKGGFPDFMAFRKRNESYYLNNDRLLFGIIGVECKINGYLDLEEREKCQWLLENKIFAQILIAKKKKEGRKVIIEYVQFQK